MNQWPTRQLKPTAMIIMICCKIYIYHMTEVSVSFQCGGGTKPGQKELKSILLHQEKKNFEMKPKCHILRYSRVARSHLLSKSGASACSSPPPTIDTMHGPKGDQVHTQSLKNHSKIRFFTLQQQSNINFQYYYTKFY